MTDVTLPPFERKFDRFKFLMRRNLNPFVLFTEWAPVSNMPLNSQPISRKVIIAADQHMKETGLVDALHSLQANVLNAIDSGRDIRRVMDDFATMQRSVLIDYLQGIEKLRRHVESTYTTYENTKQGWSERNLPAALALLRDSYTGVDAERKEHLLQFLKSKETIAKNLLNGASGDECKHMLAVQTRIQSGELSTQQYRESPTGISDAVYAANNAHIRLTGKWPGTNLWATRQYILMDERAIQSHAFNEHVPERPVPYATLTAENIEKTWQNQLLFFYKTIQNKESGNVDWTLQNVPTWAGHALVMVDSGFGHEVLFTIDQSADRRHKPGTSEIVPIPPGSMLANELKGGTQKERYEKDRHYRKWVDQVLYKIDVQRTAREPGTADNTLALGRFERRNRPNMYRYAVKRYFFEYASRYPGPPRFTKSYSYPGKLRIARPGRIFLKSLTVNSLLKTGAVFLGAAKADLDIDPDAGRAKLNVSWTDGGKLWTVPLRAVGRICTFGLSTAVDRGFKSWPFGKKGMAVLAGLGVIWGGEKLLEQVTGEVKIDAAQRLVGAPLKVTDLTIGSIFRATFDSDRHIPGSDMTFAPLWGSRALTSEEFLLKNIKLAERDIRMLREVGVSQEQIDQTAGKLLKNYQERLTLVRLIETKMKERERLWERYPAGTPERAAAQSRIDACSQTIQESFEKIEELKRQARPPAQENPQSSPSVVRSAGGENTLADAFAFETGVIVPEARSFAKGALGTHFKMAKRQRNENQSRPAPESCDPSIA